MALRFFFFQQHAPDMPAGLPQVDGALVFYFISFYFILFYFILFYILFLFNNFILFYM